MDEKVSIDYFGLTIQYSHMLVSRDFLSKLKAESKLEVVLLWGPRQVGKTTLLNQIGPASTLYLDDIQMRKKAQEDPALVLDHLKLPCLIDEAQYAPNLFPEIKLRIDQSRRERIKKTAETHTRYYLTGSNRILLDQNVKESLAGRAHIYILHGFSVKEILANFSEINIKTLIWKGGFPELYVRPEIHPARYLNDYILSFIEKDIAASAGIEKLGEFQTVLGLLAARTGQFLNLNEIAGAAGVDQKTIQSWVDILERNFILYRVPTYQSNLSKRIIKMKKLYFYDVGLCARLQGHSNEDAIWNSAQVGSLFETLVFSEIIKTRANFLKEWQIFTWRTKEKKEIDFILQSGNRFIFIEAKLAIHGASTFALDAEAMKVFPTPDRKIVVTAGGSTTNLDRETLAVPVQKLGEFLLDFF